jgi:hypothetical protein
MQHFCFDHNEAHTSQSPQTVQRLDAVQNLILTTFHISGSALDRDATAN